MSDIFQEVEEDVRRERYEQLWSKYGNYIIAAAAVLVIAVGGYQAWTTYDLNQRQQVSDRYEKAQTLAATGKAAEQAEMEFAELSKSGYFGYATLAKFNLVSTHLAQNEREAAVALLRELVDSPNDTVSSVARLRLAWLEADARPKPEIEAILQPLRAADNPWQFAAAEVLAYGELRTGSRAQAEADYLTLSQEPQASPALRQRSGAIVQYLRANPGVTLAAPGAGAPTAAPAAPAPAATPATPAPAAATKAPAASTATKAPAASATKAPAGSAATKAPAGSAATKAPAAPATKAPAASGATKAPAAKSAPPPAPSKGTPAP
jgi:hypothetical protein